MHEGQISSAGALLIADTATDLCLTCHAEGNGAVMGTDPSLPPPEKGGGNFVFLLEDNLNDAPNGMYDPIFGEAAGHSIVALAQGLVGDTRHPFSPGGSFPGDQLGCTSCHDPHGNGNFRMLYGVGAVQDDLFTFAYPAPLAVGIGLNVGPESKARHSAYQRGMSAWCANCHGPAYHKTPGGSTFVHVSDRALASHVSAQYNRYDGDRDPLGGNQATAYLPDVPFEDPSNDPGSTTGPSPSSRVMCLSCHRAHASSSPAAGRWDLNVQTLGLDGVASGSYPIPNPYGDASQRRLCWKCHSGGLDGDPTIPQPTLP